MAGLTSCIDRDFENDQNTFSYEEGAQFLSKLHANGQHYIPIVDSAIYHPNPDNASDAYPTYDRGIEAGAFMLNPDDSLYIGTVWPGYTGEYFSDHGLGMQGIIALYENIFRQS